MRWTALLLAGLMILSGCITGGSSTEDAPEATPQSINEANATNGTPANASDNATYLKNDDYEQVHVHDYWPGNSTEKLLMDETVSTNTFGSLFYTAFSPLFQEPRTGVGVTWFSLPNGSFVPVGTGRLVVEVDATGALKNGQMTFGYAPADAAEPSRGDAEGAQATWEVPVEPTMTDPPHAKSTRWWFMLEADGAGSVLDGDINVKIKAIKTRDLKEWPAHPDFWNKGHKAKLHLFNTNGTFEKTETTFQINNNGNQDENAIHPPEGTLVPPETRILLVEFWYARNSDPKNTVNGDITLSVKEGSSAGWYRWLYEDEIRDEPGHKTFAIPVDGTNWDSPYADQSAWAFKIEAPTGAQIPQGQGSIILGGGETGAGNYTIDATAYRVIPPWLQSQMSGESDERAARS